MIAQETSAHDTTSAAGADGRSRSKHRFALSDPREEVTPGENEVSSVASRSR